MRQAKLPDTSSMKTMLKKSIGDVLRPAGFVGKGQSWYLDGVDAIVVLNLQKSDYDEMYYVDLSFWLKRLGDTTFPPSHKCHIQISLTSLFKARHELIERACRVDDERQMFSEFIQLIHDEALPFCVACGSLAGLRNAYREQSLAGALIFKEARQILIEANQQTSER